VKRILTFLSDFGYGSPYPAAMKAAAAAICEATFVDISHAVPPQSVRGGAYLLWSAAPVFPPGTVHCAVVDPGVGTARAPLAVASGGQCFVGPDNGLLLPAARRLGAPAVYRLTDPAYWRTPVSATFHGRDVFAPAAAHLAAGVPLEALGEAAGAYVDLAFPEGRWDGHSLEGEVLWVDPFGNLITTIPGILLERLPQGGAILVDTGIVTLTAVAARAFGDVARGEAVALVGSDGLVEVAVNGGSAAARTGVSPGSPVRIRPA
jgi:S-adenosylmethionine hydrolase